MSTFDRIEKFLRRDVWTIDPDALPRAKRLGVQLLRLLIAVASEFQYRLLDARAGGLVYTTILSLVPFLAVTFSVLKGFGIHQQFEPRLAQAMEPLGEKGAELTERIIGFVHNLNLEVLGAVGVAGLFFTAYFLIDKVEDALNAIWQVRQGRPWTRKFTDYLSVVLVGPLVVSIAFVMIVAAQSSWFVQELLAIEPLGHIYLWLTQFAPFVLLCGFFTFFYKFVPYTKVQLTSAVIGGITAAVLWDLAGAIFAAFVAGSARYGAIYSSFAIVILFLLWLYVSWVVVLIGAQIAFFHQHPLAFQAHMFWKRGAHASRELLALTLLVHITQRYLSGGQPYRLGDLASDVDAPLGLVEDFLDEFVEAGVLCRMVEPQGVTLVRAPESITMKEVLRIVEQKDMSPAEAPYETRDPVKNFLQRRDQAVNLSLGDMTLRTFALESDLGASEGLAESRVLQERVT